MSNSSGIIKQNHRRQWVMSVSGVAGLLVLSMLPHNERGLFIVDRANAQALAAIVPSPDFDAVPLFPGTGGTPGAFFARVPGLPRAPVGGLGGPAVPDPIGPGLPPAATDPTPAILGTPAGDTPVQLAGLDTGPFGSGFPFGPGGLGPTNSAPVAVADTPATSTGGGSSTGGDTSTGGGTSSTGGDTSTGGGTTSTGGGGTSTGGDTSTGGGTTSTGGDTSTGGGTTSTGGSTTSTGGGSTSTGGDTSTGGGTTSTGGGTTSTGGDTTTSGGTTSTGGGTSSSGGEMPIPAVPEPATWMMLIAGFAITGVALRRSRRQRLNSVRAAPLSS